MSIHHRVVTFAGLICVIALGGCTNRGAASAGGPTEPVATPPAATDDQPQPATEVVEGDLISQARAQMRRNPSEAIRLLEQAVAEDPQNAEALAMLFRIFNRRANQALQAQPLGTGQSPQSPTEPVQQAAEYGRRLLATGAKPDRATAQSIAGAIYQEACLASLFSNSDLALKLLSEAIDLGYGDVDHMAHDHDLDLLRELPAFKALIEQTPMRSIKALMTWQKPFDFDFALPDLDGNTVSLKDYAGKVLIVELWTSSFQACRAEIPYLMALLERYQNSGLEVVGVNFDQEKLEKRVKTLRSFVTRNKVPYKCVLGDYDFEKRVPGFSTVPTALFVDRTGKVRLMTGYIELPELEAVVTTLLNEDTGPTTN